MELLRGDNKQRNVFVMPSYESVNARRENPNSSHRKRNKRTQYVEVLRFDYDGKYHSTLYINKDICEKHGLNYSSVMNALNPNSKNSVSYKGFIWIRKRDFSEEELARRIARRKAKKTLKQLGESKSKQIIQIDIETKEIVEIHPSILSLEDEGYSMQSVCRVLSGERVSYLDCIWAYYDKTIDYTKEYIEALIKQNSDRAKFRGRTIQVINVSTGDVVDEFPSILACAKKSKIKASESTIRKVLKGEKESFKGYTWKVC